MSVTYVRGASGLVLQIEATGIADLDAKLATSLSAIDDVRKVVRKYTLETQREAVANASGRPVVTRARGGQIFTIMRQTGKMARSIKVTELAPLSGTVTAEAEYSSYVEEGHRAIDMKPRLIGKVVPIRVRGPQGNRAQVGPIAYPVVGNSNQDPAKTKATKVQKYSSTGKKAGVEFIIFRRVTAKSRGWIIPPALPRPFLEAAALSVEDDFARAVEAVMISYFGAAPDA